jgi:alginate O-acetyltransferase complex protein AlgI
LCSARLRGGFLNLLGLSPTSTVVQLSNQLITFFLIFFSWIFFRAKTMSDATYISTHIFSNWSRSGISTMDYGSILKALLLIGILVLVDAVLVAPPDWSVKLYQRSYVRWSFYYATVLGIILFGVNSDTQFIYFQF